MDRQEQIRTVRDAAEFDAAWYRSNYQDVALLGEDPAAHYVRWGAMLNRKPGPGFDTRFYQATYTIRHESGSALLDHLSAEDCDRRPTSAAALAAQMAEVEAETAARWGPTERRAISYCIPVMGRLEDLQSTLARNLQQNAGHRGDVEFLVIEFGPDHEVRDWIEASFARHLDDGYLRVVSDTETLDTWHFGKAKNAFKQHLRGRIYSSLDADNFVGAAETRWLLQVADEHPAGFVAHHFSGDWGDGTSGRVSLPAPLYRAVGYGERLMPRQYDEIDLILGTLRQFPAIPFVGVDPARNMFTRSHFSRAFFDDEGMANRRIFGAYPERTAPLNPRGEGYTTKAPHLRDMGALNAMMSASRHTTSPDRRERYLSNACAEKFKLIRSLPPAAAPDTLFRCADQPTVAPLGPGDVALFACVKDEDVFLRPFVEHHRSLGVTRFFIVDDGSATPVADLGLGPDVHAFATKVGDFRICKTLWIEALMNTFVPDGVWMLTLDADEFLQIPAPWNDLPGLTRALDGHGADHCAGLLIDTLPSDPDGHGLAAAEDFRAFCDSFLWRETEPEPSYAAHGPIRWAFGDHAALSWRVDARFHAFGTFDSLRKIPLLRKNVRWRLNQGFHTLHAADGGAQPGPEIFAGPVVPLLHYKLAKLFSDEARNRMLNRADAYFSRTGDNIRRIFADTSIDGLAALGRDLRPASVAGELVREYLDRPEMTAKDYAS